MFDKHITLTRLFSAAATILAACAATASTADALTITPGKPSLTGRVAITEPVTVTCSPFDATLTLHLREHQRTGRASRRESHRPRDRLP